MIDITAQRVTPWPDAVALREWQARAFDRYAAGMPARWLVEATPGSGKTVLMLRIAKHHLDAGTAERIVVAVPTDHLRRQFARAAAGVGIQLDDRFKNAERREPRDMDGIVVTYAQLGRAPAVFRRQCSERSTFVMLDEIHHCGDGERLTWGRALTLAFGGCPFVLLTSGTAFREDDNPIPFVRYHDGESRADFSYGYDDALGDGVCRPILFPSFDGTMRWRSSDGQPVEAEFRHRLTKALASERLRTAITTMDDGSWLHATFIEAHRRLVAVRMNGHPAAGGLVICQSQDHARTVAGMVERVTGSSPPVAVSDEPAASNIIADFGYGTEPWLVAVRMVSEGVDIPRLRVGVYATNISTEMYFRQAAGRFVRVVPGLVDQTAYVYIPRDPGIVKHAKTIQAERRHVVVVADPDELTEVDDVDPVSDAELQPVESQGSLFGPTLFRPIDSTGSASEVIRPGVAQAVPLEAPASLAAEAPAPPKTRRDEKAEARHRCHKLAGQLAASTRQAARDVHMAWIRQGGPVAKKATLADLEAKADWLRQQLRARGGNPKY